MTGARWTPECEAWLVRMHDDQRLRHVIMARRLGRSIAAIDHHITRLRKRGLIVRNNREMNGKVGVELPPGGERELLRLWNVEHCTTRQCADKLGVSMGIVCGRIAALRKRGVVLEGRHDWGRHGPQRDHSLGPAITRRRCLMCHRRFDSDGIANRVCAVCKGSPVWAAGGTVGDAGGRIEPTPRAA